MANDNEDKISITIDVAELKQFCSALRRQVIEDSLHSFKQRKMGVSHALHAREEQGYANPYPLRVELSQLCSDEKTIQTFLEKVEILIRG